MKTIAVLIPCYNEGLTVGGVVRGFKAELPDADVYVYDNNSTDNTVEEALNAGAIVRHETRQGKGNVIRSMLRDIDADVYVMVDGDATYPADRVHDLVKPVVNDEADMVVGTRLHAESASQFKTLNRLGNSIFVFLLNFIFGVRLTDLLSGYRAFNRSIASLPLLSRGFDIETELTLKAIEYNQRIEEVPVDLAQRPEGSSSKIRIVRDGSLIFNTIFAILRDYKPLTAFGAVGLILILLGCIPGIVVIREFVLTGAIERIPLTILAVGTVLSGVIVLLIGLVLHVVSRRFQEIDYQLHNIAERAKSKAEKQGE